MNEPPKTFEANVIVFREDSMWTALALEMNVRGYGATRSAALKDVIEMLDAQISFAVQMGHPETVWNRAEEKYWRLWEETRRKQFLAEASGSASEVPTDEIADLVPLSLLALKHRDEWIAARA
jgi:hypothetical protein